MVAILILNWNGFKDTIDCIKSLLISNNQDFFIIIGDNGSTNESLNCIESFLQNDNVAYCRIDYSSKKIPDIYSKVMLCDLKVNNGFSKGNNMMVDMASKYSPDYYLLLNNDTEVEPDFLNQLILFQKNHKDFNILTPLIYYFRNKNKIWNAGGRLVFGFRKYLYGDSINVKFNKGDYLKCSFITGCALFLTPEVLNEENKVFTERFFFGEEDFEFSLRQKKLGNNMACVCDSIIYHKVGSSSNVHPNASKVFIHYLNRFINMKLHFGKYKYALWRGIYIPYIYILLRKTYSTKQCVRFLSNLLSQSNRMDSVTQDYFQKVIGSDVLTSDVL